MSDRLEQLIADLKTDNFFISDSLEFAVAHATYPADGKSGFELLQKLDERLRAVMPTEEPAGPEPQISDEDIPF